jgi:hypothetical protein
MRKRWWRVTTFEGRDDLGTFFGYVDEIALALADQQRGDWCDGTIKFEPAEKPALPKKPKKKTVNVVVDGHDWFANSKVSKAAAFFKGRPVAVSECNLYGAVTIARKR